MKKCVKQVISKNLPQIYLSLWCSLLVACSVKQTAVITAILTTIFTRHEGLVASWPRHLIGRRMTERPALSPSSILSPPLSHCSSVPAKKYVWLTFKKWRFFKISGFFKSYSTLKLRKLKLRNSGSVCYVPGRAVPFWTICKLLHVGHKDVII